VLDLGPHARASAQRLCAAVDARAAGLERQHVEQRRAAREAAAAWAFQQRLAVKQADAARVAQRLADELAAAKARRAKQQVRRRGGEGRAQWRARA